MSAPFVAAAVAMLLLDYPDLTPRQVGVRLRNAATDLGPTGWDEDYGAGLLNLEPFIQPVDDDYSVGSYVTFGHYDQNNNTSNGKEAIEWLVLDNDGEYATLISRYGLDAQPYNTQRAEVTWEACTLRSWLNSTFLNAAFTTSEQARMKSVTISNPDNSIYGTEGGPDTTDKVYLLSIDEAGSYFASDDDRVCKATDTAKANGVFTDPGDYDSTWFGDCIWWLRSPVYSYFAAYVDLDGYDGHDGYVRDSEAFVDDNNNAVRPVVVVRIS